MPNASSASTAPLNRIIHGFAYDLVCQVLFDYIADAYVFEGTDTKHIFLKKVKGFFTVTVY